MDDFFDDYDMPALYSPYAGESNDILEKQYSLMSKLEDMIDSQYETLSYLISQYDMAKDAFMDSVVDRQRWHPLSDLVEYIQENDCTAPLFELVYRSNDGNYEHMTITPTLHRVSITPKGRVQILEKETGKDVLTPFSYVGFYAFVDESDDFEGLDEAKLSEEVKGFPSLETKEQILRMLSSRHKETDN